MFFNKLLLKSMEYYEVIYQIYIWANYICSIHVGSWKGHKSSMSKLSENVHRQMSIGLYRVYHVSQVFPSPAATPLMRPLFQFPKGGRILSMRVVLSRLVLPWNSAPRMADWDWKLVVRNALAPILVPALKYPRCTHQRSHFPEERGHLN